MKIVTHTALAGRRRRQALALSLGGTLVLLAGLWLNFQGRFGWAFALLVLGTLASWVGIAFGDRWIAVPRPDVALADGLRERTGRVFALYHWVLPADHVFLAPWGVTVFAVFNHDGPIDVAGRRWRDARPLWQRALRFGRRPVAHPGAAVTADVAAVRGVLTAADAELASVPVEAVAVFTHPRVDLRVADADLPVLRAADLGEWVRVAMRRPRLSDDVRKRAEAALDAAAAARRGG